MNEQNNTAVAEMCQPTCQFAESRPSQWPDVKRPLESCRSLDAQRVANPAQSAACQGKCQANAATDMVGICPARSRYPCDQEEPCKPERLETMGVASGDSGKPLHPEIETELVGSSRPTGDVCTENVMRLLAYQRYRCALSGRELTPETASLDHIVPIRLGGKHTMENVQVLHKDVNRAKNSLTNDEFIAICREIVQLFQKCQQRFKS